MFSKSQRSFNMSRIGSKNTQPELLIRRALFAQGFRYRLHQNNLPGRPDLVFKKYRAVIFINGCFWHYHQCRLSKLPGTRTQWWKKKLEGNSKRDQQNIEKLLGLGWRVLVIWECAWRGKGSVKEILPEISKTIAGWLKSNLSKLEIPEH